MSENDIVLDALVRDDLGKGASRRLRRLADKVPAIIYGGKKTAQPIMLAHNEVLKYTDQERFYTSILSLKVNGKVEKVVLKDMQRHVFKPKIQHMDFLRVNPKQKLSMSVPLHYLGEEEAAKKGAKVEHFLNEVEITCMPDDLPEFIEVDLSHLEIGDTLHLSNIKLPSGVESVQLSHGEDHDQAVVALRTPKVVSDEEDSDTPSANAAEDGNSDTDTASS